MLRMCNSNGGGFVRASFVQLALAALLLSAASPPVTAASPFAGGNLIVVRVGDGAAALGANSTAAFIEERTTAGTLAQPGISLQSATSTSGNRALNQRGTAVEGFLNFSANGAYLTLGGYNTALNGVIGASDIRACGRIDLNANIDSTTAVPGAGLSNFRSVVSNDGNQFWLGSDGSVRYVSSLGGTSTTSLTNFNARVLGIFSSQLYVSSQSSPNVGLNTVGTGLPTSGSPTVSLLSGTGSTGTGTESFYDYLFINPTTFYVADDRIGSSGGGIHLWKLFGSTWKLIHTLQVSSSAGARGLTGSVDSNGVATLYATTTETSANRIVKITDTGASPTFTTIATAGNNTAFRGIRLLCNAAPDLSGAGPISSQTECSGNASFTISPNGIGPFTYQWRRGTTNLANGLNISGTTVSGATQAVLKLATLNAGDYGNDYNCVVTNHCGSTTSSNATLSPSSPSPYCTTASSSCGISNPNPSSPNEYISSVTFGSINNSSNYPLGCCYSNNTSQSTDVQRAISYPISVVDYYYATGDLITVWFDWEQNGDFSGLTERYDLTTISPTPGSPATFTGTITPPADAVCGPTRMRVRIQSSSTDPTRVPCGTTTSGEVQDYTVNVVPTAPSLSGPGSICQGAQSTITLTSSAAGDGETIEWFDGNSCNGTSIGSGTSIDVAAPTSGTTTWSAHVTCSNGGGLSACSTVSVSVPNCDDGNPCTDDTCNAGVCSHTNNSDSCADDSDPCTLDVCSGGSCNHISHDADGDGVCDAQDLCPGTQNGQAVNTDGCSCGQVDCDDGNPCTDDSCSAGLCSHTPHVCNDNDPCTTDTCDSQDGCHFTPINCDDGDPCTTDSCLDGDCVNTPISCNDGDPCTTDSCVDGDCVNTPVDCDDHNPCTTDSCVGGNCVHITNGTCEQLSLNVVGSGMVCAGQTMDVTLDVSGLSVAINGVQVLLHYDNTLFTLSSVSPGNGAGSPWDSATPISLIDNAGDVTYALVLSGTGSSASATVATLHFTVLLPGSNIAPSHITFRPNQGALQTKLVVGSDNSTILPGKVDSGAVLVGPRVTVTVQVQGLNHPVTRDVTFILTNCSNSGSPQIITRPIAFNASGIGSVILTGIDTGAGFLAVVEGHTLQRRVPLSFTSCFATAALTGASQLISGDLQTTGVPQDNLVDILDFAIWAARLNSSVTDCNSGLPQDCSYGADIDGDGIQDTADFNAIQMNFFDIGDSVSACPPLRHKGGGIVDARDDSAPIAAKVARLSVPLSELPLALRTARQIDQNGDGVIDARDIRAFAQARGLALLPQFEFRLRQREAADESASGAGLQGLRSP